MSKLILISRDIFFSASALAAYIGISEGSAYAQTEKVRGLGTGQKHTSCALAEYLCVKN